MSTAFAGDRPSIRNQTLASRRIGSRRAARRSCCLPTPLGSLSCSGSSSGSAWRAAPAPRRTCRHWPADFWYDLHSKHQRFPTRSREFLRATAVQYEYMYVYSPRGPAGLRPSSFSEKVLGRGPFCPSHFHSQVFCDLTGVLTVVCRILSVAEFSTSLVLV